jgi:uncharacterized protein (TIGR02246 family)
VRRHLLIAAVAAVALGGCAHPDAATIERPRVEARLQEYSARLLKMDPAAVAAMFAPEGEMVNPRQPPVHGRAAIEQFLAGFSDYKLLANSDVPDGTAVDGDTAEQTGTYHQTVLAPDGQRFETTGRLEVAWVRTRTGEWQILQLETFPSK